MSEKKGKWDVTGTWRIFLEAIDKEYESSNGSMSLTIFRGVDKQGRTQMYAKFDFSICEGWMRFETQEKVSKISYVASGATAVQKRKRQGDYEEEEPDSEHDSDSVFDDPDQSQFYLSSKEVPSSTKPTWTYRWRGRESGDYQIETIADQEKGLSVTFCGQGGAKISGTWSSEYIQAAPFHGSKTAMGTLPDRVETESEWRKLNEIAWNRECARKWGSWR